MPQLKIANLRGDATAVGEYLRGAIEYYWPLGCSVTRDAFNTIAFKLRGRPWTASGEEGWNAKRVITRVYTILATHGYSFVCSTNTGALLSSPVQLFMPDDQRSLQATAVYLGMSIAPNKRKITLIDVPAPLAHKMRELIRNYFPDCSVNDAPPRSAAYVAPPPEDVRDPLLEEGFVVIRTPGLFHNMTIPQLGAPRPYESSGVNVIGHIQHLLNMSAFQICATIPLDLPLVSLRRRELILYRCIGRAWGGY